jgi:predicted transcriptional regulator
VPTLPSLKRIRESQFMTQQMLAERAGLSVVTVARLEAGRTDARFGTVRKLARALKVKPEELVAEPLRP